jgi:hypothetical protein
MKYAGLHLNWWIIIGAVVAFGVFLYIYNNSPASDAASTELPIADNPVALPSGIIQ